MIQLIARAALYLVTLGIVFLEPAVSVSLDRMGMILYLVLIPLAFVLALLRRGRRSLRLALILPLPLLILSGFNGETLLSLILVAYVYLSTRLIRERGISSFLTGELFVFALIHYRLLLFTYSSPEAAAAQGAFGGALLFLLLACFFFYGAVIFLGGRGTFAGRGGEFLGLAGAGVLLLLFALLVGADGVFHNMIPETVNDPVRPRPELMDLSTNSPLDQGNLRGRNGRDRLGQQGATPGEGNPGEEGESGGEPRLLGLPGNSWQDAQSRSGEGDPPRQYAVMIVESELSSTYLASRYFTLLDDRAGFLAEEGNYLNDLARTRYVETWKNPHTPLYTGREGVPVSVLSVDPEKGIPYFPYTVEPTISDRTYYPFIYSWQSLSLVTDPRKTVLLNFIDSYPAELPDEAERALNLDLSPEQLARLDELLEPLDLLSRPPYARLRGILNLFSSYQYNMGFTEDWSTGHILDFLSRTREGDCTEFSNGAALLARRAGIPARVVTGYLASEELQTPNHRKALEYLREQIPPLRDRDPGQLFLVTTSHRHAWMQCWFPGYGWIDVETTGTAIPPSGTGDPNKLDVVIPIITETVQGKRSFIFPWRLVLRLMGLGGLILLAAAYGGKAFLSLGLRVLASRPGERGFKAAYRLVQMRWADRGYPPREKQLTPREYAQICPELTPFTEAFLRGVYGAREGEEEKNRITLREEYRRLFRENRSLSRFLREGISLRGLYYDIKGR